MCSGPTALGLKFKLASYFLVTRNCLAKVSGTIPNLIKSTPKPNNKHQLHSPAGFIAAAGTCAAKRISDDSKERRNYESVKGFRALEK